VSDATVLEIAVGALEIAAKLAMPALVLTLVIGVVISMVQTITQVQEATLTFVPKLLGVALLLVVGGNWMIRELVNWVTALWTSIPTMT
jgi:flagellar biosynthetic protein FliQ